MKCIHHLAEIDAHQWNALTGIDYPFIRYEFLSALEQSGVVSAKTGWQPRHLLVMDQQHNLIALLPMYQKSHSWGEFVFDQSWAQAYQQYGVQYYPKYLSAIPFTPCQGPRLVIKQDVETDVVIDLILNFIRRQADSQEASSWHCLFPEEQIRKRLSTRELIIRENVQFHWFNRGYQGFDDYLLMLTASKRKMIKRERRKISEQGISIQQLFGNEISDKQWEIFYRFYTSTYQKHQSQPYLNLAFFQQLAVSMPEQLRLTLAIKEQAPVAAALSFIGGDTLYGRYWGCEQDFDALHFEVCYYQGIDYCLAQGLLRFDSGAQGEHKIARGFEPVTTYSVHWIKDARFDQAISDFVHHERTHVDRYKDSASGFLPFKDLVGNNFPKL